MNNILKYFPDRIEKKIARIAQKDEDISILADDKDVAVQAEIATNVFNNSTDIF